jgi:hypothetical protein
LQVQVKLENGEKLMSETEKWTVDLKLPEKKLTREDVLFKVTLSTFCSDARSERLGMKPSYKGVFTRKLVHDGKTTEVMVDTTETLLPDTVKVLERLTKKYSIVDNKTVSATEWKQRARLFQHCSKEQLTQIHERIWNSIERLKELEAFLEVYRAHDYLHANLPLIQLESLEEAGKHWLTGMLLLHKAHFSYYAAQEACDKNVYTEIDKTDQHRRYGLAVNGVFEYTNLPCTWNDESVKTWRMLDEPTTTEKARLLDQREEREKQCHLLRPLLVSLIREGHSNDVIKQKLEALKKPRLLVSDLMMETDFQRFKGAGNPTKVTVTLSSPKEQVSRADIQKLIGRFDADVTALFPAGLSDQEIFDRVTHQLGDLDRDGTQGRVYQVFLIKDQDMLRGRIRNLRRLFDTQTSAPTAAKERGDSLDMRSTLDLYPPETMTLQQDFTETVTFGHAAGLTTAWLTRTIQSLADSQGRSKYWTLNDMHDAADKLEQAINSIQTSFNTNREAVIRWIQQKFTARVHYLIVDQGLTTQETFTALTTGLMAAPKYAWLLTGPNSDLYVDIINQVYVATLKKPEPMKQEPWNTPHVFNKEEVEGTHKP